MHGKALEYQPWHIGYSCLKFFTIGELSAADLPPEGDGEQDSGFDISIDVFPRLHERDPYRQGYLIPLSHSIKTGLWSLPTVPERVLKLHLCKFADFNTLSYTCRRLGVGRDSSFEEVQDARNYLYDVSATTDLLCSISRPASRSHARRT